jgi:hypothetical protein
LAYKERGPNTLSSALRAGVKRLNNPIVGAVKSKVFEAMPALKSSLHYSMAYGNLDWSRTKAYAVGTMGNVYLNVRHREPEGCVEPADYETVRAEVIQAMRALRDPDTDSPIFDFVYRREEIYSGDSLQDAPDVVGLINGPYHVAAVDWRTASANGESGNSKSVVEKVGSQLLFVSDTSGQHRMDGILIAEGAEINSNVRFSSTPQLIDLAPTILQLLGETIPGDMDGRVLQELLAHQTSAVYAPAPAYAGIAEGDYSAEDQQAIEERLAGLGYLG